MFTGIIQALGRIESIEAGAEDTRLAIGGADLIERLALGDSVAVNGVCLTVTGRTGTRFCADVSRETLTHTTLGELQLVGARVNLEPALTLATPLGGHLVSGHVDGVGSVLGLRAAGRSQTLTVRMPSALTRYVAKKGSICIDGVSLTVNAIDGEIASINVVPHTLTHTVIGDYRVGTRVNLEVDLLARYLERLLAVGRDESGGISATFLAEHGFLK